MTALSSGPEPQPTPLLDAAVSYGGRGWKVVPFCWVEDHDDIALCSCGDAECPCPGGHLVEGLTLDDATSAHDEIVTLWSVYPMANIALVTGGTSAVIVAHFAMKLVPPAAHSFLMPLIAQCCAVSLHDGDERLSFFIAAGPEELAPIGHVCAGLRVSAGGELVMLPPSRTPTGRVRWEEEQVTQLARSPWRMALRNTSCSKSSASAVLPNRCRSQPRNSASCSCQAVIRQFTPGFPPRTSPCSHSPL